MKIAKALTLSGRASDAEAKLRNAQRKAPRSPEILGALADHLVARGQADAAIELYDDALRASPRDRSIHEGALEHLGAAVGCRLLPSVERWLTSDPTDPGKLRWAAKCHLNAQAVDKALPLLEASTEASSDDFSVWTELATAQVTRKDFEGAMGSLMVAYSLNQHDDLRSLLVALRERGTKARVPRSAPRGFRADRILAKLGQ